MVGENEEYKYHQYTNEKERSECEYTLITLLDILYVYTCILAQCVPVTTCRLINIFFIKQTIFLGYINDIWFPITVFIILFN